MIKNVFPLNKWVKKTGEEEHFTDQKGGRGGELRGRRCKAVRENVKKKEGGDTKIVLQHRRQSKRSGEIKKRKRRCCARDKTKNGE